eukprot:1961142-Rhodomonas_salina.1
MEGGSVDVDKELLVEWGRGVRNKQFRKLKHGEKDGLLAAAREISGEGHSNHSIESMHGVRGR